MKTRTAYRRIEGAGHQHFSIRLAVFKGKVYSHLPDLATAFHKSQSKLNTWADSLDTRWLTQHVPATEEAWVEVGEDFWYAHPVIVLEYLRAIDKYDLTLAEKLGLPTDLEVRKQFCDMLIEHSAGGDGIKAATNAMYKVLLGADADTIRRRNKWPKSRPVRPELEEEARTALALAEIRATALLSASNASGPEECARLARLAALRVRRESAFTS